jgi:hypothetical protein
MLGMKRRQFITLVGGAAAVSSLTWPLVARSQEVAPGARSADRPARIAVVSFIGAAVAHLIGARSATGCARSAGSKAATSRSRNGSPKARTSDCRRSSMILSR